MLRVGFVCFVDVDDLFRVVFRNRLCLYLWCHCVWCVLLCVLVCVFVDDVCGVLMLMFLPG